jgi:hypothetical protein
MKETKHEKGLIRVIVIGSSLSFGGMAAFVVSMKDFIHGNAALEFSYKTVVAFVIRCLAGWGIWTVILRKLWIGR